MYYVSVMETKHLRVPSRTHFIDAELIGSQQEGKLFTLA